MVQALPLKMPLKSEMARTKSELESSNPGKMMITN